MELTETTEAEIMGALKRSKSTLSWFNIEDLKNLPNAKKQQISDCFSKEIKAQTVIMSKLISMMEPIEKLPTHNSSEESASYERTSERGSVEDPCINGFLSPSKNEDRVQMRRKCSSGVVKNQLECRLDSMNQKVDELLSGNSH